MVERRAEEQGYGQGCATAPGLTLLKSNGRRSVYRDGASAPPRILKVFHAQGLPGLLDGRRARRELEGARDLLAAGIPTPRPLGIERMGGRPALATECIEPAWTLERVLQPRSGRARVPARVPALQATAELLVRMERAGCTHPDLHPGNVLLPKAGPAAMLLDVRGVRTGQRSPGAFDGQLAHLGATLRDGSPRAWRVLGARFQEASAVRRGPERWGRIEDDARRRRLDMTHRRLRVWRRESAETELTHGPGGRIVKVRAGRVPLEDGAPERMEGTRAEVNEAWRVLTLAAMHRLPAARPVALALDDPPWVECVHPAPVVEERLAADAPEELRSTVSERGLRLEGTIEVGADGAAWIGPRGRLIRVL